jgi:hypothetical protein
LRLASDRPTGPRGEQGEAREIKMQAILDGTQLRIVAEADDVFEGEAVAIAVGQHPQAGRVLECRGGKPKGRKPGGAMLVKLAGRPAIAAAVAQWQAAVAEAQEAERATEQEHVRKLESGEEPITLHYHDGEVLSGHTTNDTHAAKLLKDLGLGKYVSGWGFYVDQRLANALGKSFTYLQAAEFVRPEAEAKAVEKVAREAQLAAKFAEAGATGKPVAIGAWTTERCMNGNDSECSFDRATEYAMPDGSRKTTYTCCY